MKTSKPINPVITFHFHFALHSNLLCSLSASDSGSTQRGTLASVTSNGWVVVSARQRLTATCQLKLQLFPFDTQHCNITFASMTTDGKWHHIIQNCFRTCLTLRPHSCFLMTFTDKSIKLGTFSNDTTLTRLSENFMVTQGEWQLLNMDTFVYDLSIGSKAQSKLTYRVGKASWQQFSVPQVCLSLIN